MKRRIIAALMALCLCIGLLPATALAVGDIYEGNDTFYYHITDSSLANMVAAKRPEGSSSEVSRVTITFNEDYSAGEQNTFVFRNGYTIALSNVSDSVQPDDIAYLTISFVDGESIRIEQNELNWTWVSSLPRRYDLRLATDDNTCTVTFYYQPGDTVDNSAWQVYREVPVEKGTSLGNLMPALPNEGTAHWVAWENGSNNGTGAEFTADTIVNSDLTVYARKVTSGAGSEYHIMNPDNSLLEAVLELYLDDYPDSEVTTDDVQISRISVVGSEDSTNPNYSPVGTSYGWQEGTSWYWIYNLENHTLPEGGSYWNDRVPPNDIQSITIYATVDGNEETYSISRSELDVRVRSNVIIEIYLRDTNDEEEDTPPDAPDKDTVIDLAGENAVAVKCTTNTDHQQDTSELSAESITVGSVVSNGEGGYTCTITVAPDSYVTAYNGTYSGHRLDPTGQTGEILLVHDGENWVIAGEAPYVTFTVSCGTDYAIDGFTKKFVDSTDERAAAEAAGIDLGGYDFPNTDGKVIIPEEEDATVTLLYAITVTGNSGASFTVTDEDAELVEIDGVAITEGTDTDGNATFSGTIPEDAETITFYVSKTFTAEDLTAAADGEGTVLSNTAAVEGTEGNEEDPNNDDDTEETPAEEEDPTKPDFDADDLAGVTVQVLCVQNPTGHTYKTTLKDAPSTAYKTSIESCEGSFGDWKCTVSIDTDVFVGLFNSKAAEESWGTHAFSYATPDELVFYYTEASGWLCASDPTFTISVTEQKSQYTLTYDANGGVFFPPDELVERTTNSVTLAPGEYTLDKVAGYLEPIPYFNGQGEKVLFAGWTMKEPEEKGKVYHYNDSDIPEIEETVTITDQPVTVYAVWSYDENDDEEADINQIVVKPADITIYMGGTGYEGTVDASGNIITSTDGAGLPEPGFIVTLPAGAPANTEITDLEFKEADGGDRTWRFETYDGQEDTVVYKLVPQGDEQTATRVQFTKANGEVIVSDEFTVGLEVNTSFTMALYKGSGATAVGKIVAEIDGKSYSVNSDPTGTLTVRGTTDGAQYAEMTPEETRSLPEEGKPAVMAPVGTTYAINGGEVQVQDSSGVALLFDAIIDHEDEDRTELLQDRAEAYFTTENIQPETGKEFTYEFKYLDLVDQNNGNVWVAAQDADGNGRDVTVYWPLPEGTNADTKFTLLHFKGLHREMATGDIATEISECTVEEIQTEVVGSHVTFKIGSAGFSPFALVWQEKDGTTPADTVTVTFKVVNGTWRNGSSQNIVYTINKGTTLASNSIAVPTGMQPESGYTGGSWDTTPNTTTTLNGNVTYTYRFTRSGGGEYNPKDATLRFNSRGGTEFEDEVRDNPFRYNPYNKIPTRPGYRFTGWYDSSRLDDRYDEDEEISVPMGITTVWAGWEETSVPSMLNGDDHYAYIQGYSDGTVRPNANITRAQVATIFFRLLDEDVRDDNLTTYNTFPDVDQDYWANTAISTMASLGVINGRNSGLFDPDAYITRAEFAAICARFDDSGVDGITTFTDTVGHWAEDEISRAAALGWIQGYADGTFRPNQYITRAQAVTMINRVLCRLPEDTDDLLSGMNTWTDCHEDDWFYLAIQEATNSHDFVAKDRVYESWTDLNRAPDWSRYE